MPRLDAAKVISRVRAAVPNVTEMSVRFDRGDQSGHFVCTLSGRMRAISWRRQDSVWTAARSDEEIASGIVRALKA